MSSIGERIRKLIRYKGLTFGHVAQEAGIARETLSGIVNGKQHPHRKTLEGIAKALGVKVVALVHESPIEEGKFTELSLPQELISILNSSNGVLPENLARDVSLLRETLGIISLAAERGRITEEERELCQRVIGKIIGKKKFRIIPVDE